MKKILSIVFIFCLLCLTASCGAEKKQFDSEKNTYMFQATVLQTEERSILVKTDDAEMLRSGDQYWVSLPENISGKDFSENDIVKIVFDGMVSETYPLKIEALDISRVKP